MRPLLAATGGPPLTPGDDTARRWLTGELSKPEYAASRPTWFDELSRRIGEWFASLHIGGSGGPGSVWLAVIGAAVIAAIVVVALLLYGLPRRARRARAAQMDGAVADDRTAAQLRAAADRAADAQDWGLAVVERFRALAASLSERTMISLLPGTTAREVGAQAARPFPAEAEELHRAADVFDAARYLGRRVGSAEHSRLRELDERLRRSVPEPAQAVR